MKSILFAILILTSASIFSTHPVKAEDEAPPPKRTLTCSTDQFDDVSCDAVSPEIFCDLAFPHVPSPCAVITIECTGTAGQSSSVDIECFPHE